MPTYTQPQLFAYLTRLALHSSQKELAQTLGISPQYLNDVINGRREPGKKLLAGLEVKRVVTYVSNKYWRL